MSKVTVQNNFGEISIVNRLTYPEKVNMRIYNEIASGTFQFFLPVSISEKRKEIQIECSIRGLMTVAQYLNGIVSKESFLDVVYQIAQIIKECEKRMLVINNLDLQKDRVFIQPSSNSVYCIYWPIVNNQNGDPPYYFLKKLPYETNFSKYEDVSFLEKYCGFFDGNNPFSINAFDKLLLKLRGETNNVAKTIYGVSSYSSGDNSTELRNARTNSNMKDNIEYDPFAISEPEIATHAIQFAQNNNNYIFCISCGSKNPDEANFCYSCGKELLHEKGERNIYKGNMIQENKQVDFRGESLLGVHNSNNSQNTDYCNDIIPNCPILTRIKTGENYDLNKPLFIIGTDRLGCDLVVSENKFISRQHLKIIIRNGHYYIIDLNSTNKTYVNGNEITGGIEVEIFDGTTIMLANEGFVFSLE